MQLGEEREGDPPAGRVLGDDERSHAVPLDVVDEDLVGCERDVQRGCEGGVS